MESIMTNISTEADMIKMLIDNTPVAYIIMDKNYRIHYINKSFAELRNLDMAKTIGNKCYNISNGGVRCANCAVAAALASGEQAFVSRKDILPNGAARFIDDYAVPLQKNERGETEFILEIMINRTEEMLAREQRNKDYDEILSVFAGLLAAKDSYTAKHSENVRLLSLNLAREMGLSPDEVFEISIAASLHDIGKVDIPLSIINKTSKLDDSEYKMIKNHPGFSDKILEGLSSFGNIRDIARHHHERTDGRGYPDNLAGEAISLGAQIVAVADTYDAITTTRSYRKALTHEYALAEIARVAGTQLGREAAEAFSRMDFKNMTNNLYEVPNPRQTKPVVRVINESSIDAEKLYEMTGIEDKIDLEKLLDVIFKNTPCGYVLMDKNRVVRYASDYFFDYMGLTKEGALGRKCYEAQGGERMPCENCCLERALASGKVEYARHEQYTNKGRHIFDLYGVPLPEADGGIEQVIEIVIDRTEEILLDRIRRNDFGKLIDTLGELLERHNSEAGDKSAAVANKINELRNRLNESLNRKTL